MRSLPTRACLLVLLSALLQVFSFPTSGPVALWRSALGWIALIPFLFALFLPGPDHKPTSLGTGALLGYLCGIAWYLGNCSWIYQTMYLYGGMARPVAFLILILFSLYLGLYHALFAVLLTLTRRSRSGLTGALLLTPFLWVAVELARARVTGFPWDLLGYTQVDNLLLTRLAPIAGVMALSFVIAAANTLLTAAWFNKTPRRWYIALPTILAIAIVECGATPTKSPPPDQASQNATLVQENLSVGVTARGDQPMGTAAEIQAFTQNTLNPQQPAPTNERPPASTHPTVIIWPEAPSHLRSDDPAIRTSLASLARTAGAPLIVGALGLEFTPQSPRGYFLYDSALVFAPTGAYLGRYDKIHLVPWGEYVPYKQFFAFASKLTEGAGDMDPGHARTVFTTAGHTYGVFVCYESIFGDEVRHFTLNGAQALVNISDDGWYGDTGAPWQHLNMTRMRAIENHRWLLLDTNTGETTAIAPNGFYTRTERHIRTAYTLPFAFFTGTTFYTRHGDWFAWLCTLITLAALAFAIPRRKA